MEVLANVVKYREGILLLEWEREVQQEKIADYEYEKLSIGSQSAPKEFRMVVCSITVVKEKSTAFCCRWWEKISANIASKSTWRSNNI